MIARLTEVQAYEIVKWARFAKNGGKPYCPKCEGTEVYDLETTRHLKDGSTKSVPAFKCKRCRHKFTVTSGTPLSHHKMSFQDILFAACEFVHPAYGLPATALSASLGCAYTAAFILERKFRDAIGQSRTQRRLGGAVDVDGTMFTKSVRPISNTKRGRKPDSSTTQVVVGVRERGYQGESRAIVVEKSEAAGVDFVLATIEHNAAIYVDGGGWSDLATIGDVQTVNHKEWYRDPTSGNHTNTIESLWARLKQSGCGTYKRVRGPHLQSYVDEALWREDHRHRDKQTRFLMVLSATLTPQPKQRWKGYWQRHQAVDTRRRDRTPKQVVALMPPKGSAIELASPESLHSVPSLRLDAALR